MKNLILAILLFSFVQPATSQLTEQWTSYFDESGNNHLYSITGDDAGNLYAVGDYYADTDTSDGIILKYNSSGAEEWQIGFGGDSTRFTKVILDGSGNLYARGIKNRRGIIVKLKPNGNIIWSRTFNFNADNTNGAEETGDDLFLDNMGNVVYVTGSGAGVFRTKYDSAGNQLWSNLTGLANSTKTEVFDYIIDESNNIYIAGSVKLASLNTFFIVAKYNSSGNYLWHVMYDSVQGRAKGIGLDNNGFIYVSGDLYQTAPQTENILTMKLNVSGTVIWKRVYNNPLNTEDYFNSIVVDANGNSYIFGEGFPILQTSTFILYSYNTNGDLQWEDYFYHSSHPHAGEKMILSEDGYLYAIGNINVSNAPDALIVKYSKQGSMVWQKRIFAPGNDFMRDIFLKNDKVFVSGLNWRSKTQRYRWFTILYSEATGISQIGNSIPDEFNLSQNYPNPFNPSTKIKFSVPSAEFVSLKIYDLLGKEVSILLNAELRPGEYEYTYDAKGLASGIYFYKLEAEGFVQTRKMILIK